MVQNWFISTQYIVGGLFSYTRLLNIWVNIYFLIKLLNICLNYYLQYNSVIKLPADYCPNIFVCGMVLLFLDFSRPPTLYNCLLFFFQKNDQ